MNVGDLITGLQRLDPTLEVWTMGCDCDAVACSVEAEDEYEDEPARAMIYRGLEGWYPGKGEPSVLDSFLACIRTIAITIHEAAMVEQQQEWDNIARQMGERF